MKAMVLCAGYGTRLGDLTREIPKPMLSLGRRPMLEYILCHLKRHGFNQIGLNLHFMPDTIRGYLGDGSRWGLEVEYSHEPNLLGTAGGTKKMETFLRRANFGRPEPFLVHYGDVVTNQDLTAMFDFHRQRKALATLLVHERRVQQRRDARIPKAASIVFWSGRRTPSEGPWPRNGSFPASRFASRKCSIWFPREARVTSRAAFLCRWPDRPAVRVSLGRETLCHRFARTLGRGTSRRGRGPFSRWLSHFCRRPAKMASFAPAGEPLTFSMTGPLPFFANPGIIKVSVDSPFTSFRRRVCYARSAGEFGVRRGRCRSSRVMVS